MLQAMLLFDLAALPSNALLKVIAAGDLHMQASVRAYAMTVKFANTAPGEDGEPNSITCAALLEEFWTHGSLPETSMHPFCNMLWWTETRGGPDP